MIAEAELETRNLNASDVMVADPAADASERASADFSSVAGEAAQRSLSGDSRTFLKNARQPKGE